MIFGPNLLALLVLALGGALAVGNFLALISPRQLDEVEDGELDRPPLIRSLAMIGIGLLAAIWAIASIAGADDTEDAAIHEHLVATEVHVR